MTDGQRIILAVGLPLAGPLAILVGGAFLMTIGLRGATLVGLSFVLGGCAVFGAAALTPRAIDGRRYSFSRKIVAGIVGLASGFLVAQALSFLGLDSDALSHKPSSGWSLVQEGIMLPAFYGAMFLASYAALGRGKPSAAGPQPRTRGGAARGEDGSGCG